MLWCESVSMYLGFLSMTKIYPPWLAYIDIPIWIHLSHDLEWGMRIAASNLGEQVLFHSFVSHFRAWCILIPKKIARIKYCKQGAILLQKWFYCIKSQVVKRRPSQANYVSYQSKLYV